MEPVAVSSGLWRVPAYLPHVHEPLSPRILQEAEARLGVSLPRAYRDLLAEQNGGYVRRVLPGSPHSEIWGVGAHFPSITQTHRSELRRRARRGLRFWQKTPPLVPFDGDGHWYLCLDYRVDRAEPRVAFIDLEAGEEQEVAASFQAFLALLQPSVSPHAWGLVGEWTPASAAQALGAVLGAPFEDQGSWAHGYPVWRCALGDDDDPQWCWIGPDEVPRAFVREDHARYAQLRDRMPGTARRFPELPEVAVEVSCTEGAAQRVLEAGRRAGMELVPLAAALQAQP